MECKEIIRRIKGHMIVLIHDGKVEGDCYNIGVEPSVQIELGWCPTCLINLLPASVYTFAWFDTV